MSRLRCVMPNETDRSSSELVDWHIVRRDRPDVSITSEDILSGSIAQKGDIAFYV